MNGNPWLKTLIVLLVFLVVFYLGNAAWQLTMYFADVVILFLLACIVAVVLGPVANALGRISRLPRLACVSLVYLGLLAVFAGLAVAVVPATALQLIELGTRIPEYAELVPPAMDGVQRALGRYGIPPEVTTNLMQAVVQRADDLGTSLVAEAFSYLQGLATLLFEGVLLTVLSFYIMLDGERMEQWVLQLLPTSWRGNARFFFDEFDRSFVGYLRGTLILAVVYGVGTMAVMVVLDVPFWAPVGIFGGAMMFVPLIGPIVAMVPPLLIALFADSVGKAVVVFICLMVLQQIVLNGVSPRVLGQAVGLHPLVVILALLVGIKLAGLWGALFAIPIAAVVVSVGLTFARRALPID